LKSKLTVHHIGIVVPKISDSIKEIQILPFEEIHNSKIISSQKVKIAFLKIGTIYFELIEPDGEDSPVYSFSKQGGGIHHICFEVDDIHQSLEELKSDGAKIIVNPVKGYDERLIAFVFLNMKHTNCNIIELLQKK